MAARSVPLKDVEGCRIPHRREGGIPQRRCHHLLASDNPAWREFQHFVPERTRRSSHRKGNRGGDPQRRRGLLFHARGRLLPAPGKRILRQGSHPVGSGLACEPLHLQHDPHEAGGLCRIRDRVRETVPRGREEGRGTRQPGKP